MHFANISITSLLQVSALEWIAICSLGVGSRVPVLGRLKTQPLRRCPEVAKVAGETKSTTTRCYGNNQE